MIVARVGIKECRITVVGVSVGATYYMAEGSNAAVTEVEQNIGPHRYVISDAYYQCRDHIDTAITQKVRNINVDSHSSRYDQNRNDNVVFIDLELLADVNVGEEAKIVCRVSAADNEIKSFQISRG